MKAQRLTLSISGLTCGGGGALVIERALARAPGVARVYVNPATEMAYVEYDADLTNPRLFAEVVERLGFKADEPNPR